MAILQIPVGVDVPSYTFQIQLDNTLYQLSYNWCDRQQYWYMSIADSNKNPLVNGVKLLSGINLFGLYIDESLPGGQFVCVDTSNSGLDPDKTNFGGTVLMLYIESGTVF
jgi:hypothetical protein